jgi:hypothetical protein
LLRKPNCRARRKPWHRSNPKLKIRRDESKFKRVGFIKRRT